MNPFSSYSLINDIDPGRFRKILKAFLTFYEESSDLNLGWALATFPSVVEEYKIIDKEMRNAGAEELMEEAQSMRKLMLFASFVQKGEEDCLMQLEVLKLELLARLPAREGADQLRNLLAEMAKEEIEPKVFLLGPETANHVYRLLTDMQQTQFKIQRNLSELSHPHEIRLVRAGKKSPEKSTSQS